MWRHFAGRDFPLEGFCERLFPAEGFELGGIFPHCPFFNVILNESDAYFCQLNQNVTTDCLFE